MDRHRIYIKELLESEHSKKITDQIVDYIEDDPLKFKALVDLFFSEDWCMNQRAAWPIPFIAKKHSELVEPYLAQFISNLENPRHNAVIRNTLRFLAEIEIPEDQQGRCYDFCLRTITNIKEPVANKIFAMTIMLNIALPYPELLNELKIIIETQIEYEKPGFKSRGRNTLSHIEKSLKVKSS